jgi:hypothetical protein
MKNIQENDTEIKKRLDHKDLDLSREEVKKIHIEVTTCDAKLDKSASPMTQMVEKTKLYDRIYLKYGVKIQHLIAAVKIFKIDLDEDIALPNSLSTATIAKITAAKQEFPDPGTSEFFNFDFCLAALKLMHFHVIHEEFLLREK